MKVDPKTGSRYGHTTEEWAEVLRKHGAGMSLPASVAGPSPDLSLSAGLGLSDEKPLRPLKLSSEHRRPQTKPMATMDGFRNLARK